MVGADANGGRDVSLPGFLAERARVATAGRLATDVAVGSVAVVVAIAMRPEWWQLLASAGLSLFSFGVWSVTRRIIASDTHPRTVTAALGALRVTVAAIGVAAAVATGFFLWATVMGTWIS